MMKKVCAILVAALIAMLGAPVFAAQVFSDLPQTHWAYASVTDLCRRGVVNGYEDGTFRPDAAVTRAQLAKLIATSANLQPDQEGDSGFADVVSSDWYYPYVKACKGIFDGYRRFPDGLYMFNPNTQATRLDTAVAIAKALKLDVSKADESVLKAFKDVSSVSPDDRAYLALAVGGGIIQGYPDGTFAPEGKLTRAEIAAMLLRAFFKN